MKKTILYSALLSMLSVNAYADLSQPVINSGAVKKDTAVSTTPSSAASPTAPANIVPGTQTSPTSTSPNQVNAPIVPSTPATTGGATQSQAVTTPAVIDCNYHLAPETKVDQALLLKWSEKAVQQSFDLDHQHMTQQLTNLKLCYTDQGWKSFNDALEKSGNIDAIKSQKLTVSSMVQSAPSVEEVKDNQWKVSLPLQVVYQNDKDKLTQALTVDLIIGRKSSGDLGIMQIIASPSSNKPLNQPATTNATTH